MLAAHESLEPHAGASRRCRVVLRLKTMLGFAIAAGFAAFALFSWTQHPAPAAAELVARVATLDG